MTHILVSNSSGKDSTATLLVAIERNPINKVSSVFCDTGNEHPLVYDYIRYLEDATRVPIKILKQDFSEWWWRRRDYVRDEWPKKGVHPDMIASALAVYELGPTGNPYLDLCIIKNRFPSRTAQFCTQFLKTEPATEYALNLIAQHGAIESWQGVRADESRNRANLPEREELGGGLTIVRPIHKWTAEMVFEQHRKHGIKPNPLYSMGMGRVGCMPCINAKKDEVLEISKRFPEHFDRIEKWEHMVGRVSKRGNATFFPAPGDNDTAYERGNVRKVIEWSKTSRGGRQIDLTRLDDAPACASSYGLCE